MSSQEKPKPGDFVILSEVPEGFLNDLPQEDRQAISDVVGKAVRLNEYDDNGRAEIEFTDSSGTVHFLYVSPDVIRPAK